MMNDKPLSDDEIEELDNFLVDGAGLEEAMDMATLDGFLTAIISGPKLIPASEWMPWVWDMEQGKESPEFESQAQAERIIGLLMRHMNDIAQMLTYSPQQYAPLLMENQHEGDKIPVLDEWCCGFMKGVELDSGGWLPVTAGHPDWLSTILLYGTEEGWDELRERISRLMNIRRWLPGWLTTCSKFMLTGSPSVDRLPAAVILCAAPLKSAATNCAPADQGRNTSDVMGVWSGCIESERRR